MPRARSAVDGMRNVLEASEAMTAARFVNYDDPIIRERLQSVRSTFSPPPTFISIHAATIVSVAKSRAICGDRILILPAVPEYVILGGRRPNASLVTLDEVELEAGWIANLPRHFERPMVMDFCSGCMKRVAAMRAKLVAPRKRERRTLAQRKVDDVKAWQRRMAKVGDAERDWSDG